MKDNDFSKPLLLADDEYPTLLTVEFTEDGWSTIYRGSCIERTIYSYKVRSDVYGTF